MSANLTIPLDCLSTSIPQIFGSYTLVKKSFILKMSVKFDDPSVKITLFLTVKKFDPYVKYILKVPVKASDCLWNFHKICTWKLTSVREKLKKSQKIVSRTKNKNTAHADRPFFRIINNFAQNSVGSCNLAVPTRIHIKFCQKIHILEENSPAQLSLFTLTV